MFYYLLAPADRAFQDVKLLTYSFNKQLATGQIVVVKLRTKTITAFVVKETHKPEFKTSPVERVLINLIIPVSRVELFNWIRAYYPGAIGSTASLFTPSALKKTEHNVNLNDVIITTKKIILPALTSQQATIFENITKSKIQTHIIHGDTGTGKTRLYIELALSTLEGGKSVIMLTPEISLTPQLYEQFNKSFNRIFVIHSGLTNAERRDIWAQVNTNDEPKIIIGPRSALFYPVKNLGLIVIDEFHDSAYKQDQAPRYNAVRVAGKLARICNVKLVLGSATPPIENYYYASLKLARIHRLTEKPISYSAKKLLHIIDLSQKSELTPYPLLTNSLLSLMKQKLAKNEQIMLFINKRGSSRLIVCQNCGWNSTCERCNIPFTYHHDSHSLLCHTCGLTAETPHSCPDCGSENILFKNPGTKAIVESLQKIFPDSKIGRYDKDNKKDETFVANQQAIYEGKVDILVGTQLLSKGHDLPKLSLVGILFAESNLQFPDFSSEERSFQLLHQISGRVARSNIDGDVVLQTYRPDQKFIKYIEHNNKSWEDFYSKELIERKKYNFPPYCYLLKIEISRATEKNAEKNAEKIALDLRDKFPNIEVLGPAPSFSHKRSGKWYWHVIVKSSARSTLIETIKTLPKSCTYDIEPNTLL